jgi:hypothetical protein
MLFRCDDDRPGSVLMMLHHLAGCLKKRSGKVLRGDEDFEKW